MEEVRRLGAYRIDRELNQSSTTTVYRGYEEALSRPVLIKKLHPQMAREADIRERFEREARVCEQVKHENIVIIHGYQADEELTMLVLEFVEGENLGELISRLGALDFKTALAIFYFALKGLAHAHSRGVIHRDLKPENLLISNEGRVKISDFGLAVIENAPQLTMQGTVVGTPAYMSPEQISGDKLDPRSDLFSLGVTFYETLTGVSPFRGESFSETMQLVLNAELQKPSLTAPTVPPELDQLVLRLVEKRPNRRYATAAQALQDVKSVATQYNVPLEAEFIKASIQPQGKAAETKPPAAHKPPSSVIRKGKSTALAWSAGAALVVLASIVIFALLQRGSQPDAKLGIRPSSGLTAQSPNLTIDTLPEVVAMSDKQPVEPLQTRSGMADKDSPDPTRLAETPSRNVAERETSEEPKAPSDTVSSTAIPPEDLTPGQLVITTPGAWAEVSIDRRPYGQTPLLKPIELPPGEHLIVLTNAEFPAAVDTTVRIEPGRRVELEVEMQSNFGSLIIRYARPWATVFIDGNQVGETPLVKPFIVTLGRHTIELRNAGYRTYRVEVDFQRGDPPFEIAVDLEPIQTVENNPE